MTSLSQRSRFQNNFGKWQFGKLQDVMGWIDSGWKTFFSTPGNSNKPSWLHSGRWNSSLDCGKPNGLYTERNGLYTERHGKGELCQKLQINCLLEYLGNDWLVKQLSDLYSQKVIPEGQKGSRWGARGINGQLLIYKVVVKNSRRGKANLNMVVVDFRKAYDIVPNSWMLMILELFGTETQVIELLQKIWIIGEQFFFQTKTD